MSSQTLGIIFSNMHDEELQDLTVRRTIASIPFGGRYRLIDFVLSNMYNSGITKVGVITKSNYQSLMDHVGSGKEWDMAHKREGLFILPPFGHAQSGIYKSRLDALSGITDFLRRSTNEYVLMSDSNVVCNMNLNQPIDFHIRNHADITAICRHTIVPKDVAGRVTAYHPDHSGRVTDMELNPAADGEILMGLNMWVVGRAFLERIVAEAASRGYGSWERDVLQKRLGDYRVFAWEFDGYAGRIDSIKDYFRVNMDLLRKEVREELFYRYGHIYTKVRDEVPAKYGPDAAVSHSFVADGCTVEGSVEDSILFRGVHIGKGSHVSHSIVMQGTRIGENVRLNYLIVDKDAYISDSRVLMGYDSYPLFIGKGGMV